MVNLGSENKKKIAKKLLKEDKIEEEEEEEKFLLCNIMLYIKYFHKAMIITLQY